MKSQLKAGAFLSYIILFLNSAISLIYTPIMLKILGQSEYGLYSLASATVGLIGVLNFGLGNAVIRYTAKFKTLQDEEGLYRLYGMFLLLYGILGLLAFIIGTILTFNSESIFSSSLSSSEGQKLQILMGIMVINTSIGIALGLFSVIILAYEKFIFQKTIVIISALINPVFALPLLMLGYGSVSLVVVTTILNLFTIILNINYCFRKLKIKIIFGKFNSDLLKEVIIFSFYIFLNLIIEKIYWSTDQIILGIYSGTVAVSIYTIGASFSGYFSGFSAAISGVFLSRITGMVTKDVSNIELSNLFIKIGRIQYIIISFAISGFIIFGYEFILLWVGNDYSTSYVISLLILIPMVVPLIQSIGGVILQAKNLQKFKSLIYLLIALLNILLSLLFVKWWGPIGCAIATALAFTLGNIIVMNFYYWKRVKINIPKFWINILLMSIPLFSSILIGGSINNYLISENWFHFIIKVIIFSIIYSILMWLTAMNRYEKGLFLNPIRRNINKILKNKVYKAS